MTSNGRPRRPPAPPFSPNPFRFADALSSDALAKAIDSTPEIRPHLVEGFILEHSVNIISSAPGQGKTCIILMVATQGSVALPVFGDLEVPRPLTTYIFCPERPSYELRERCKKIRKFVPYDLSRIVFDDGMTGLVDLSKTSCEDTIFFSIDRHCPHGIDIFAVDGLYGMSRKPLASEETANSILRFNSKLMNNFGCSPYYNHHFAKTKYDNSGIALPPNPFGSQFLYANATGTYNFERLPGPNLSTLKLAKDTVSGLISEITLSFDHETFSMVSIGQSTGRAEKEKLRRFINACLQTSKEFSYDDLSKQCNLRIDTIRRYISPWVAENRISNVNPNGVKALFKTLASV